MCLAVFDSLVTTNPVWLRLPCFCGFIAFHPVALGTMSQSVEIIQMLQKDRICAAAPLRFAELVNSDSPCPSSKQPPQYDGAAEVPLTATVACGGWHLRSTNDCGLLGIQDLLTPVNRKSLHKGLSTALTSCIILMRINPADLNM